MLKSPCLMSGCIASMEKKIDKALSTPIAATGIKVQPSGVWTINRLTTSDSMVEWTTIMICASQYTIWSMV